MAFVARYSTLPHSLHIHDVNYCILPHSPHPAHTKKETKSKIEVVFTYDGKEGVCFLRFEVSYFIKAHTLF